MPSIAKESVELRLPSGLKLLDRGLHIEIIQNWWRLNILFETGFVIILWDYGLVDRFASIIPLSYIKLFLLVAAYINDYVVASRLNKTHIFVG